MMSPGDDNSGADARLRRLEEAQAFADHQTDQLSGEVERAFAAIKLLTERLDRLERRIAMFGDHEEEEAG